MGDRFTKRTVVSFGDPLNHPFLRALTPNDFHHWYDLWRVKIMADEKLLRPKPRQHFRKRQGRGIGDDDGFRDIN